MEIDHRTVSQKPIEAHFCTRHTIIIEKQQKGIPIKQGLDGDSLFSKKDRRKCDGLLKTQLFSVQLFIASAAFLSIFLRLSEEFFSLIREGFSQGCITNFALQEVFEFIEVRSLAVEEEGLLSLFLQFRIITVVAPVTAINGCLCFELGVTHAKRLMTVVDARSVSNDEGRTMVSFSLP